MTRFPPRTTRTISLFFKTFAIVLACFFLFFSILATFHVFSPFPITAAPSPLLSIPQEEELQPLPAEEELLLNTLLRHPFTYIGEGGQAFVFASFDDRYVLKFFRCDKLQPAWWVAYIPDFPPFASWRANHISKREAKLKRALEGHRLAYALLKKESALATIQLVPPNLSCSSSPPREARLIGKSGIEKRIDLNGTLFVLQEKGEILSARLGRLLEKGKLTQAKEAIAQIAFLYRQEEAKCLLDADHGVMHNVGFVGERPIHLDVGSICKVEDFGEEAPSYAGRKIVAWLHREYPQYEAEIAPYTREAFQ